MVFWQTSPYTDAPLRMLLLPTAACERTPVLPPPPPPLSKVPAIEDEQLQYEKDGAVWGPHAYPAPGGLPADPAALRAALEKAAGRDNKAGVNFYDNYEFDYIPGHPDVTRRIIFFELAEQAADGAYLRPAASRALRGHRRLPGVRLIPHVRDAAGRPGTEVQITVPRWRAPRKDRAAWCSGCDPGFGPDVDGFILDPHTYRYLGLLGTMTDITSTGPGPQEGRDRPRPLQRCAAQKRLRQSQARLTRDGARPFRTEAGSGFAGPAGGGHPGARRWRARSRGQPNRQMTDLGWVRRHPAEPWPVWRCCCRWSGRRQGDAEPKCFELVNVVAGLAVFVDAAAGKRHPKYTLFSPFSYPFSFLPPLPSPPTTPSSHPPFLPYPSPPPSPPQTPSPHPPPTFPPPPRSSRRRGRGSGSGKSSWLI